jgi:hypothetical protein
VHGISTATKQDRWRPNLAWIALAAFIILVSVGTNVGEIIYLYVLHDPRVVIGRRPADALVDDVARILMLSVGLMILWRAGSRRSCFFLATGIIAAAPFPLFPSWVGPAFNFSVGPARYVMPAFAIAKLQESNIRVSVGVRWIFGLGLAGFILSWLVSSYFFIFALTPPSQALQVVLTLLGYSTGVLAQLLTVACLGYGWRRAGAQEGHRFFILLLAVSVMIVLGNILFSLVPSGPRSVFPRWVTNSSSLFRSVGAFLFAYAILKHRVIDIGFAINRTLVYGAVTFTLLAAFGLAEFATKSLIPEHGAEAGSIITAATAVLLFLSFHHVHHWFEHQIERLFFHSWHVAEAALKRFVASAGQFAREDALCSAFADELRRFAQGADVALFLSEGDANFCLEAGGLTGADDHYSDRDRAFALMREERRPIELSRAHSSLPGELAVPMLDQSGLAGFVLLGSKPDGSRLRPDQEENIGWATHQIGLDLQALKARGLDEELVSLRHRLAATEAERDRLLSTLAIDRKIAETPALAIYDKRQKPRRT